MNKFSKIRLRELLILMFVLFIIIPFLILAFLYIEVSQNYVRRTYGNYLTQSIEVVQSQMNAAYTRFVDGTMNFYNNGMVNILEQEEMAAEDELLIQSKLDDILNSYSGSVSSVFLVVDEQSYTAGVRYQDLADLVQPYEQEIADKRGRHVWIGPHRLVPKNKSGTKLILGKSLNGADEKNIARVYMVVDIEEFIDFFDRKELDGVSWYLSDASQMLLSAADAEEDYRHLQPEQNNGYSISKINGVRYLTVHDQSAKTGWVVDAKVPMKELLQDFEPIKIILWVLAGIYIIFLIAMLILMEKYVVFPVRVLTEYMDEFAAGNFDVTVKTPAIGELKRLNRHFNKMTVRIVELIQRNEQEVKEKNEFKMQTLRAQLSPHFMYNSLNTIKWMAVINKQQNIQDLSEALIQLMMSHTRGREENYTIADEIRLIQNYVIIQKSRFMNFDIRIQIDADVMECKMIKFLLQPVVENSILHGFARGKKRRGIISITAYKKQELHIVIEDNGVGFDVQEWEQTEKKTDKNHTHIAIVNIRQIIALEYGEEYGISIQSESGKGTRVEYCLPIIYDVSIRIEDKGV